MSVSALGHCLSTLSFIVSYQISFRRNINCPGKKLSSAYLCSNKYFMYQPAENLTLMINTLQQTLIASVFTNDDRSYKDL